MNDYFEDKRVLITGSSQGIGLETARQVLRRGGRVMLNARSLDRLESSRDALAQEFGTGRVYAVAGDVSDPVFCGSLVEKTIHQVQRLDILINNAGVAGQGRIAETSEQTVRQVLEVNLLGAMNMTRAALPALTANRGRILFVSSLAGIHGLPGFSAYSISKMGMTALAESLAAETRGSGVRIGVAYVGFTENETFKTQLAHDGSRVPLPPRKNVHAATRFRTATRLLRQIESGRARQVHSGLGKILSLANRFSPELVTWFLGRMGPLG